MRAENILVIHLRQVGDVLLTTPAVKALREAYPRSRISYLTETGPATLLQGNPHLDRIITRKRRQGIWHDLRLAWELRQARYDLVVDFFCNPRTAWMAFFTGAPQRLAAYHASRAWWYTHTPKLENGIGYAAEDKLALLRTIGIDGKLVPPVIQLAADAQTYIEQWFRQQRIRSGGNSVTPIITIDPTSRRPARRWIPERYTHLADRLVERYAATVIFLWGPGEYDVVAPLAQQGKHPHLLACPTDLMQLAALIARSDLHIGNCSAPSHIAVAVGTPSLTVIGPTRPANWTYPSPMHQVVRGDVACLECQKTECTTHECMHALTVQDVEHALEHFHLLRFKGQQRARLQTNASIAGS
ncbi:hypothetical protein GF339_13170 [candidate division KSB3 bacterium]|uniref:Glycosyltransferase family 9 protein n=1 Tax=candidate division KSB3 bacterium TaxID=2044937 RepID=A0A9D5JWR9_9BACT|nr:hypothetical protein [candidate division KSB3 bacterium]MBD3325535.1 hypothetical protein [candidate division KSB3 bacterium]